MKLFHCHAEMFNQFGASFRGRGGKSFHPKKSLAYPLSNENNLMLYSEYINLISYHLITEFFLPQIAQINTD